MLMGTTANLRDYLKEVGKKDFQNWIADKCDCLEELADCGFNEANIALTALQRSYEWIAFIEKWDKK